MAQVIDTCGRSCPEPVIMTKQALSGGADQCEVLVDNQTALGNVSRFAGNNGYSVKVQEEGGLFRLLLKRS